MSCACKQKPYTVLLSRTLHDLPTNGLQVAGWGNGKDQTYSGKNLNFNYPTAKAQVFLWDPDVNDLAVRGVCAN